MAIESFDLRGLVRYKMLMKYGNLVLLSILFLIQTAAATSAIDTDLYGGIIKNRKTDEAIGLKCVEMNSSNECVGFNFVYLPSVDSDPKDWKMINPNFTFHENDLTNLKNFSKIKMKYRVNPNGFAPPWFGGTMLVWNLIEENRNSTGKKLPLWILYGFATPIDIATAVPIAAGTGIVFGTKRLIIAIQGKNISNAFEKIKVKGKVKRLGKKNFSLIKALIEIYPALL